MSESLFGAAFAVVGVDLSLTATGVCLPDGQVGTIRTQPGPLEARLLDIVRRLLGKIEETEPVLVVIEGGVTRSPAAFDLGMLHGVIRSRLYADDSADGWPFILVPPATLKKFATGDGRARKPDLRVALYKRTGMDIKDDNEVDAWWLRTLGLHRLGTPLLDLPKAHTETVGKILLPPGLDRLALPK